MDRDRGKRRRSWLDVKDCVVHDFFKLLVEQNSMYRWIHEVEAPRLFKSPSAWWRHRVPVSVKHLEMLFVRKYGREDTSKVPRILKEFLEHVSDA